MQTLIFSNNPAEVLSQQIAAMSPRGVYVLADSNTARLVWPRLRDASPALADLPVIEIPAGDVNKNLESLTLIWSELQRLGATRHSLMVNVGGGMVTDIGGFAASTFKRGMKFINVPTTLLAAVDASVGGKTGINFGGLKNEVGVFSQADTVVISATMFDTLPAEEIRSGYGEMLKHGLLQSDDALNSLLDFDPVADNATEMLRLVEESVEVKRRVVEADPLEKGLRKSLNLGHTVGHAFESLAMAKGAPVPHGYAVAWGIVTELVLSHMQRGFSSDDLRRIASYIERHYGVPAITCDDYPALLELMSHDKKNVDTNINFTLLDSPGSVALDCTASADDIKAALDITRDLLHI